MSLPAVATSSRLEIDGLVPGLHVVDVSQRFLGIELGARMTVLELAGGLLVHSPIAIDPSTLAHLGDVRWVLAPNLFHHLYVGPWADLGVETWAAPGLPDKRKDVPFHGVVESASSPFGPDVLLQPLSCMPLTNEVVVLHRPSRTLVVTDLVFNIPRSAPWMTRAAMTCLCGYPGCRTTLLERVAMRRDVARREIEALVALDFDRIIMAHGDVVETGGKAALLEAFSWLGPMHR